MICPLALPGGAGWWEEGSGLALAKGTDIGQRIGHGSGQRDCPFWGLALARK